jgi:hypothetical protein
VALLIENKISAGAQPNQAKRYRDRGKVGLGSSWDDFKTILIAPAAYSGEKAFFDTFVPLEQISQWLCPDEPLRAAFRRSKIQEAIEKRNATGVQIVDAVMTDFRSAYYEYLMAFNTEHGTDFTLRRPAPTYDGDTWFSFNSVSLPAQCRIRHRAKTTIRDRTGAVDVTFLESSVDRLEPLRRLLEPSMSILSSGRRKQHASIETNVSEINEQNGFELEKPKVHQALLAAKCFRQLIVDNIDMVRSEVLDKSQGAVGSKVAPTHNAALPWKPDGSVCPTCGGPGRHSERYPAAVCHDCETSVLDGHGKTVKLYNQSMSGGLLIVSGKAQLIGALAERVPLFIKGIECRAREHRLGGVVLQPVEAWKASENF